jgi:membrane protease YdiL (CAAX protease family)
MARYPARRPAAAWLAAWIAASLVSPAAAQTRVVAPIDGFTAPVTPVVPAAGAGAGVSASALTGPLSNPSLPTVPSAPSVLVSVTAAPLGAAAPAPAVAASAPAPTAARVVSAAAKARPAAATAPTAVPSPRAAAAFKPSLRPENAREAAAFVTVEGGVASWGAARVAPALDGDAVRAAASDGPAALPRASASSAADRPAPPSAPATESRARPRAARAVLIAGGVLVAGAAAAFTFPAAVPAVLAAAKGPALWAGLGLMSLSRLWRVPGEGVEAPRGPPAAGRIGTAASAVHRWLTVHAAPRATGQIWSAQYIGTWLMDRVRGVFLGIPLSSINWVSDRWTTAREGADAQAGLEARAGDSSVQAFGHWILGGLRAAVVWVPVALASMFVGLQLSKPFVRFANPLNDAGMISLDDLEKYSLGGHMLGYVAASLAAQAVTLGVFDGVRALAAKAGAGRASPWIAGAAALAVSAALILTVTTVPSVVGTLLGIEAAALWLRSRSNSWLAPLVMRGLFSLTSLEFARIGLGLTAPALGGLIGLPAVWTGVAVFGMLLVALAWSAKSLRPTALWSAFQAQLNRVREFGASWAKPNADGSPKSPLALMKLAALWGWVLYALGDLTYSGVHAVVGGTEPTPAILVQMLTSPVDLVLANFLLVGFLEEYVFRRGIFKPILNRFSKWKMSNPKAFWAAAVASGLIFSYAHYIDFGAMLAHFGIGAAAGSAPVASGMYAFSLGGFLSRAVLGVVLAWLYAASGTLLLPAAAHFLADSYEGLGLRWGFVPFLAMAAVSLLVQLARKRGATHRS